MKIALLISGGVDSSVSLMELIQRGEHDITAFYLKIWLEDELAFLGECPWEEDLTYARSVCQMAGVPLKIVPFQKQYWDRVVKYTIDEVKAGRTPNPDILCNQQIKFGAFYDKFGKNFDKIATGHYAQTGIENKKTYLKRAPDPIKDQTYFLSMLSQAQIAKALFPIGHLQKTEVRRIAEKYNLLNKNRKDSQGICFLGKISFNDFLKHYLGEKKGDIVEKDTGRVIGEHNGFWFHTIGQRKGMNLNGGPWYVVAKDHVKNIVYVSHGFKQEKIAGRDEFVVENMNWISFLPKKISLQVKIRHGERFYDCVIISLQDELYKDIRVKINKKDTGITPGQFAVFYDGQICLGGGVISEKE